MQPLQAPPARVKELPSYLKVVLALKGIGCLAMVGLSYFELTILNRVPLARLDDGAREQVSMLAQLTMIAAGMALVELLGVVGTWGFKRWGVYVLAGFSMMDLVLRLKTHESAGAAIGLLTTTIAFVGVAVRWRDFE